jgi:uncharacterized iron-regulated membrane protein
MARLPLRKPWVAIHRYVGLALAAFLVLEGLTGSVLAFAGPLSQWLAPQTVAPPHPGAKPLSPGALAQKLEDAEPRAQVGYFPVNDRQAVIRVLPRDNPATGRPYALDFDHVILDPVTGRELAKLRYGDLSQGLINVIPFIDEVHQNLALGPPGTILFGVVAVLWTLDCILAVYLTLPVATGVLLAHWGKAWSIKWPTNSFRLTFDLHRAGSLWLWPVLFVFAWSSVMFTLPEQVYQPVTNALFSYTPDSAVMAMMAKRPPSSSPKLTWAQAEAAGAKLMGTAARDHHFHIVRPYGMAYIPGWNVFTYAVVTAQNVQAQSWDTSLWLDGDSGGLVKLDIPAGQRFGNRVDVWLRALHFGDLNDNLAYRIFVALVGLATTILSITGVLIWLRKRQARLSRVRPANRWRSETADF